MSPKTRRTSKPGFTLVEVLIVVVILAILAAIVIPRYSHATDEAKSSNMFSQLQTIRSQILLYQAEHDYELPTLAQMNGFSALINRSNDDGTIDAAGPNGPYLRKAPENLYTESTTVVAPGAGGSDDGWEYDEDTGFITAVGFDEDTGEYTSPD